MELADIKSLIDIVQQLGLAELAASKNGVRLRLVREATPWPTAPAFVSAGLGERTVAVRADLVAPLSGVLHLSPSPGAAAFVVAGQAIKRGDTLCIVEAMKVFNRVTAERDGVIEAVLVESGTEIEAGQTLMRIA